jgi:hypothetical protein
MKRWLAIIMFVFCVIQMNGQPKVMSHLFKDKAKDLNPYISSTFQFSEVALQYSTVAGLGAGVIINKKIILGLLYHSTFNEIALPVLKGSGLLKMKMEGVHFEYTLWPLQKIHLSIPLSAGIGQLKITDSELSVQTGKPSFLFAEPGLILEINVWKYAKLGISTSYRYTSQVGYGPITSTDLNGFIAAVSVKFGMFNYAEHDIK